jgi:hypothetical protein
MIFRKTENKANKPNIDNEETANIEWKLKCFYIVFSNMAPAIKPKDRLRKMIAYSDSSCPVK